MSAGGVCVAVSVRSRLSLVFLLRVVPSHSGLKHLFVCAACVCVHQLELVRQVHPRRARLVKSAMTQLSLKAIHVNRARLESTRKAVTSPSKPASA